MRDVLDTFADPDLTPALPATMLGMALAILLLILVHEGGHVLFGRLAGYRVRAVRIGRGPTLFRLPMGLALLDWRLLPISGAVAAYRPFVRHRNRRLLMGAGGCLANAAAAGVLYALLPWSPDTLTHPVTTYVLLAQVAGLLNLVVVPRWLGRSDGTTLLAALRQPLAPDRAMIGLYETSVGTRYPSLPAASPLGAARPAAECQLRDQGDNSRHLPRREPGDLQGRHRGRPGVGAGRHRGSGAGDERICGVPLSARYGSRRRTRMRTFRASW